MCDVPSIAVFCSESIECFLGMDFKFFFKRFVAIPVAPVITGTITHFMFRICCISVHELLYFKFSSASKLSHLRCVYINNRCRHQSITQQYLKRCVIKDDNNYMFRPNAAIIRFSSESMVVVLYRIGKGM